MKFLKYFYLFVASLLLVVVLQNLEPSGLNVLAWKFEIPKGLLWLVIFFTGFLLSELRHIFRPKVKVTTSAQVGETFDMNI